jgi:hypothetical protein
MNGPSLTPRGPNLQGPRRQNSPEPYADLVARLVQLRRDLNDVSGSILRSAGIRVAPDGMTVESSMNVVGDLRSTGNTDIDGTLNVDATSTFGGDASFHGSVVIDGNLAVPNGSITNAALSNPVTSGIAAPGVGSGFATSTAYATKAATSIAVPAGYSQALVCAIGSVTFQDASPNRFDTRVGIAGGYGAGLPNLANTVGSTSEAHTRTLTGLAGGSITLEVQCLSAVASGGQAANTATVTGFAIFFR